MSEDRPIQGPPYFANLILEDGAIVHYKAHMLQFFDVLERISFHCDHFRRRLRQRLLQFFSLHIQHFSGARGCRLNRVHRRHSQGDHSLELLRDGLSPRNSADVCTVDNFQMRLQCLFEADFMNGGRARAGRAFFSAGSVGGAPSRRNREITLGNTMSPAASFGQSAHP